MREDIEAAFRSLRSSADFTIAALLVLTLAIGASTALFSVVDAVVLRGLPFDESDRLVAVGERQPARDRAPGEARDPDALSFVTPQNYLDWSAQQQVFQSMAAIASGWLTLHQPGGEPESLVPQYVTAGFFDVLRVRPALGRAFTAENEMAGRHRVIVLSYALWRRAFGGDPRAVGRAVTLDDIEGERGTYEILGVMPPEFAYPVGAARATEIWLPYVVPPEHRIRNPASRSSYLQVIARLGSGVSLGQAQAQMNQVAAALERANPTWNKDSLAGVRPLVDHVVGARTKSWMLMLLGAVGLVLLIGCANVANLLLARAASRQREVAIRAALGAGRLRLIRLFLLESLLLSVTATASAVVVAWWAVGILRATMPDTVPRVTTIAVDGRVLISAVALSLVTALLVGIAPALRLSRPALSDALKEGGRTGAAAAGQRLRGALVVAELALSVVLLVGAALFIGSFTAVMRIDPGFTPGSVLTAQVSPRIESRRQPRDSGATFGELVERVAAIPGVLHASMIAGSVPLQGGFSATSLTIPDRNIDLSAGEMIGISIVTPDFHRALNIPLRRGRFFDATERRESPPVVIINESAARKYFPGRDPIGRRVGIDGARTIVGVVGDVRSISLEVEPRPEAYIPMVQSRVSGGVLAIRTSGNPYDALAAVKTAVLATLPDVPLRSVMTMEELIGKRVAQRRLNMLLLGLFGVLGLLISVVGVYGLLAGVVSRRTREIGVRIALGATPARVFGMVLRDAAALVASGLVIGSAAAWYLGVTADAFLFRIRATDPWAFLAALLLLGGAALFASALPARRAAMVDPAVALRAE